MDKTEANEETTPSVINPKHKINTRWHLKHNAPVARYSAERPKIEATYWSRANRRNKWKLVSESLDEFEYIFEFSHKKFRDGFYAGARVGNTVSTSERINNLASNIRMHRYYTRAKHHAHENFKALNAAQYALGSGRYHGLLHGVLGRTGKAA